MHFVLCQGGQEGTRRSQMAYLFPQETRRYLAGHLPNSRPAEIPLFREGLVQTPPSLSTNPSSSGYALLNSTATLWSFLPETAFLGDIRMGEGKKVGKGEMGKQQPLLFRAFARTHVSVILIRLK